MCSAVFQQEHYLENFVQVYVIGTVVLNLIWHPRMTDDASCVTVRPPSMLFQMQTSKVQHQAPPAEHAAHCEQL